MNQDEMNLIAQAYIEERKALGEFLERLTVKKGKYTYPIDVHLIEALKRGERPEGM